MTSPPPIGSPQVSLDTDQVRSAFEAAWNAGERTTIEKYLADEGRNPPKALLRELLRVELALRMRAGERPTLEEYRRRFPDDRELILAVFADTPTVTAKSEHQLLAAAWPADGVSPESWPAVPGYQ